VRLICFLLIGSWLAASSAFAQPLDSAQAPFRLADRWYHGLEALDQATKDLQRTNALLSTENMRLKTSIQNLNQQAYGFLSDLVLLSSQSRELEALLNDHQEKMLFFLEQSGNLDKKYLTLIQEKASLANSINKEKELSRELQKTISQSTKDIEGIEKSFFTRQQKDQQLNAYLDEGQSRVDAWFSAQDQGWQRLGQDVRTASRQAIDSYLAYNCANLDRQHLKAEVVSTREKIAAVEKQGKILAASFSKEGSDEGSDTLVASQAVLEDLQELLNAKRKEWQAIRKAPASPAILLLRSDIDNLQKANHDLNKESLRLQALLKSLDRQKRSLEKTFTQR